MVKPLKNYHKVWLSKYGFSEEWLREKLAFGFHIHHADGDKANEAPSNLIMIYGRDHLQLHGFGLKTILGRPRGEKKRAIWITPDKGYFVVKRTRRENAMRFYHLYRKADAEFIASRCRPIGELTLYEKARYL